MSLFPWGLAQLCFLGKGGGKPEGNPTLPSFSSSSLGSRACPIWVQLSTFPKISRTVPQCQERGKQGTREGRRKGGGGGDGNHSGVITGWSLISHGWSLVSSGLSSRAFCTLQDRTDKCVLALISSTASHSLSYTHSFLFS